ncbi:helix-turn-helix domain-containing protein [Glycomyces paridis]|uniref:AraC family transcriptional regulator n=1 Tax=Glycomyces paridis TaxID=2126555 RepID=A0A4S8PPK9_9ACTN|nr:helix-turn-helix domain-containing protein [Glycomyces paridis]THV32111.1 AraC family transcriptional regulator [Glycomyces paridis]
MQSAGAPLDWARANIAVPPPSLRLPGISMAGFGFNAPAQVDIAMVAHPSVTVLIDLSDDEGAVFDAAGRRRRGSVAIGLAPGEVRAAGRGSAACLQIRLGPVAAASVLGESGALSGTLVPLADLWGREAEQAEERLRAAPSWQKRFAIATDLLGRRMDERPPVDREVAHAWRRTLDSQGRVRVESLAAEVGWSRKRLWSRFRTQLGISPKHAARLVRFDRAAHLLAEGRPAGGVAAESGYADQSHLHREVKAFTGLTPTAVADAPWLAIDHIAWPATTPMRQLPR